MEDRFSYGKLEKPGKFLKGTFTVMFIDIVRFTKYGDNEALRNAVRALNNAIIDVFENLLWDESARSLENDAIMMPTGDGYGIAFEGSVDDEEVLSYAVKLSNRLKKEAISVRIGINKGPCYVHKDVNNRLNLAGWGIVDAQRVMSVGGKDHILCTREFAKPYNDAKNEPNLHSIGTYPKKGRSIGVYNFYSEFFGNKVTPSKRAEKPSE